MGVPRPWRSTIGLLFEPLQLRFDLGRHDDPPAGIVEGDVDPAADRLPHADLRE